MICKGPSAVGLLLIICLAGSPVLVCEAAEVWFRPAGEVYGAGDGTTYYDAYSGIDTHPWNSVTASKIAPGDTVHICGHHRGMLVVLDDNLTIDLVCSAHQDPGTINGADLDDGLGWRLNENMEYQKVFSTAPKLMVRDGQILEPGRPAALSSGQWGCVPQWLTPVCDNSAGPWTVSVKDDPFGHVLEIGARNIGIQLGIKPASGRGIRSLTVHGGGVGRIIYQGGTNWGWGKGISTWSDGWPAAETTGGTWTIDGVTFIGQQSQGIHTYGNGQVGSAPSRIVVTDNTFYDIGAEALYLKGGSQVISALIAGNVIGSTSHARQGWDAQPNCSAATGDGIDMAGGPTDAISHAIVRNNVVMNARGYGIGVAGADITIEGNTVINANFRHDACPGHAGIFVAPTAAGNVRVSNNRVTSTFGDAMFLGGVAIGSGNSIDIYHNTFDSRTAVGNAGGLQSPYVAIRDGSVGVHVHSNTFCSKDGADAGLKNIFRDNMFARDCDSPKTIHSPQQLQVR